MNKLEMMCELSDFYLQFLKENSTPNPTKPPPMLKPEDFEKLMRLFKKQGNKTTEGKVIGNV
ncbi:MAG: hypothetical protein ACTSYB_12265 [Candidatus Helarchaeota archaeon]